MDNNLLGTIEKVEAATDKLSELLTSNDSVMQKTISDTIDNSIHTMTTVSTTTPYLDEMVTVTKDNITEIKQKLSSSGVTSSDIADGDSVIFYENTTYEPVIIKNLENEINKRNVINTLNVTIGEDGKPSIEKLVPDCELDTSVTIDTTEDYRLFTLSWEDSFTQREIERNNRIFIAYWVDDFIQPPYDRVEPIPVDRCFTFEWLDSFDQPDYRQIDFNDGKVIINEICIPCLLEDRTFTLSWEDDFPQIIPDRELNEILNPRTFMFEWVDTNEVEEIEGEVTPQPIPKMSRRSFEIIIIENSEKQTHAGTGGSLLDGPSLSRRDFKLTITDNKPLETFSNGYLETNNFSPDLSHRTFIVELGFSSESVTSNKSPCSICSKVNDDDEWYDKQNPAWKKEQSELDLDLDLDLDLELDLEPDDIEKPEDLPEEIPEDEMEAVDGKPDLELTISCDVYEPFLGISQGMGLPPIEVEIPTISKQCDTGIFSHHISDDGYLIIDFTDCGDTPTVIGKVRPEEASDGKSIVYFQIKDNVLYSMVTTKHGVYTEDVAEEIEIGRLEYPDIVSGKLSPRGFLTFTNSQDETLRTPANLLTATHDGVMGSTPSVETDLIDGLGTLIIDGKELTIGEKSTANVFINKQSKVVIQAGSDEVIIQPSSGENNDITDVQLRGDTLYLERAFDYVMSTVAVNPINDIEYIDNSLRLLLSDGKVNDFPLIINDGLDGKAITDIEVNNTYIDFISGDSTHAIPYNNTKVTSITYDGENQLSFKDQDNTVKSLSINDFNGKEGIILGSIETVDNTYKFTLSDESEITIDSPTQDYVTSVVTYDVDDFNIEIVAIDQDGNEQVLHNRYEINASSGKILSSIVVSGTINEYFDVTYNDGSTDNIFVGSTVGDDGINIEEITANNDTITIRLEDGQTSTFTINNYNGVEAKYPSDLFLDTDGLYYLEGDNKKLITNEITSVAPIPRILSNIDVRNDKVTVTFSDETSKVLLIDGLNPREPGVPENITTTIYGDLTIFLDDGNNLTTNIPDLHGKDGVSITGIDGDDISLSDGKVLSFLGKNGESFGKNIRITFDESSQTTTVSDLPVLTNTYFKGHDAEILTNIEKTNELVVTTSTKTYIFKNVNGIDSELSITDISPSTNGIEQTGTSRNDNFDNLFLAFDGIVNTDGSLSVFTNHSIFPNILGNVNGMDVTDGRWVTEFTINDGNLRALLSDGTVEVIGSYQRSEVTGFNRNGGDISLELDDGSSIDLPGIIANNAERTLIYPYAYINGDGKIVYVFNDGEVITSTRVIGDKPSKEISTIYLNEDKSVSTLFSTNDTITSKPLTVSFGFDPYFSGIYQKNDTVVKDSKLFISTESNNSSEPSLLGSWSTLLFEEDEVNIFNAPSINASSFSFGQPILYTSNMDASISDIWTVIEYVDINGTTQQRKVNEFATILTDVGDTVDLRIGERVSPNGDIYWSSWSSLALTYQPSSVIISSLDNIVPSIDSSYGYLLVDDGDVIQKINIDDVYKLGNFNIGDAYYISHVDSEGKHTPVVEYRPTTITLDQTVPSLRQMTTSIRNEDSDTPYFNDISHLYQVSMEWEITTDTGTSIIEYRLGDQLETINKSINSVRGRYKHKSTVSPWSTSIVINAVKNGSSITISNTNTSVIVIPSHAMLIDDEIYYEELELPRKDNDYDITVTPLDDGFIKNDPQTISVPMIGATVAPPVIVGYFHIERFSYYDGVTDIFPTNIQFEVSTSRNFDVIYKVYDFSEIVSHYKIEYHEFEDGVPYYHRVRAKYDDVWTEWSNIEQFGYKLFTTPGNYNYEIPDDVESISMVAVGGGSGNPRPENLYSMYRASGGSLRYLSGVSTRDINDQKLHLKIGQKGGTEKSGSHTIISSYICASGGEYPSDGKKTSYVNHNVGNSGFGGGNGRGWRYVSTGMAGGYLTDANSNQPTGESGTAFNNPSPDSGRSSGGSVGLFGTYVNTGRSLNTNKHGSYPYTMARAGSGDGGACILFGIAKYPEGLVAAWSENN